MVKLSYIDYLWNNETVQCFLRSDDKENSVSSDNNMTENIENEENVNIGVGTKESRKVMLS